MKEIQLSQGKVAVVDDEDFEELSKFKWCAVKYGNIFYAIRNCPNPKTGKKTTITMHRQILGLTNPKEQTDHVDGNGLNNQRSNIRVCNKQQNGANRSAQKNNQLAFKGVSLFRGGKFRAQIQVLRKNIHLGLFKTPELAAAAYDAAARKYYGEFARTNF